MSGGSASGGFGYAVADMHATRSVLSGLVFLAAFLLFAVEPMTAKQLLPVLGGASAVWVTCLVFFQVALLLGYLYAHWIAQRGHPWMHVGMLVCALLLITVQVWYAARLGMIGGASSLAAALHPVRTIFAFLSTTIGLPFLLLAATSPMLQVWWVRLVGGTVPYRLFALSNAGSLLGLMMYPAVIEPHMTLAAQRVAWRVGFAVYAVGCGWIATRASRVKLEAASGGAEDLVSGGVSGARRLMWFLLPMGAAMQLCAVTSHLSQDVAAIPLLWILPLAVYLLTFVLAFEAPGLYRRWMVGRMLAVMLASLGYALSRVDTTLPIGMAIAFYLVEVFVACWFCHAEAYRLRPETTRETTEFYLLIAAGGAAGTFLLAVVSPMVFRANYDLAIAFLVTAMLALLVTWQDGWAQRMLWAAGTVLLASLVIMLHIAVGRHALMHARNFYGALRVTEAETDTAVFERRSARDVAASGEIGSGPVRTLLNGRIRHGTQMLESERRRQPTTYYGQDSGIGVALRACCEGRTKRVGVVGLGVGTLAAYTQPGDVLSFYEINPLVEPIARNLFTYLRDSPASIRVVEGDGRASLEAEQPQGFDVLVVDAFSGDAIPLHLLTREAMMLYRRHLAATGVVAFHVSNAYLDLAPQIALLAQSAGMRARRVENWEVPAEDEYAATWVLVSADGEFFSRQGVAEASTPIDVPRGMRVWTDDYSNLVSVIRWSR